MRLAAHGTVLLQDTLPVAEVHLNKSERKYKPRRVFLFEQVIVFTELSNHPLTGHYYKYKSSIKVSYIKLSSLYQYMLVVFLPCLSPLQNLKYYDS